MQLRGQRGAAVQAVLDDLAEAGLQSDRRFAESYLRSRLEKAYGPVKIRQELASRGIDQAGFEAALEALVPCWETLIGQAYARKYGARPPADAAARAKAMRFLQQRGFNADQIRHLLERLAAEQHDLQTLE